MIYQMPVLAGAQVKTPRYCGYRGADATSLRDGPYLAEILDVLKGILVAQLNLPPPTWDLKAARQLQRVKTIRCSASSASLGDFVAWMIRPKLVTGKDGGRE